MILKLTANELNELRRHESGPYGEDSFESFMAEANARVVEDSGEIDLDRDDFERIATYKTQGHQVALERVFKRAMDSAFEKFFG